VIPIEETKRIDWNVIKADYIGGASYGILSKRYGLSKSTIYKKSVKGNWQKQRERTANAIETKTIERMSDIAADSAVKLEEARKAAIEVAKAGIEKLKSMQGSKLTTRQKDSNGNPITVDFDLLNMVTALEKLQRMGGGDVNAEPVKVIIDV